jgi:hypothetical protein
VERHVRGARAEPRQLSHDVAVAPVEQKDLRRAGRAARRIDDAQPVVAQSASVAQREFADARRGFEHFAARDRVQQKVAQDDALGLAVADEGNARPVAAQLRVARVRRAVAVGDLREELRPRVEEKDFVFAVGVLADEVAFGGEGHEQPVVRD